jgi:hypothetical protein
MQTAEPSPGGPNFALTLKSPCGTLELLRRAQRAATQHHLLKFPPGFQEPGPSWHTSQ